MTMSSTVATLTWRLGRVEVALRPRKSSIAIRAAAPPPTALKSDTSCGIAVIFTVRAVYRPRPPPNAMPAAMITQPMRLKLPSLGRSSRNTMVATMATAMPPAESRLPLRAVAGEFIRTSPSTNATAPASQAMRTSVSRTERSGIRSGLRLVGGGRRGRGRGGLAPEHLEHAVGDDVAADDVHGREGHRDERQQLGHRVGCLDGDEHRADENDAVNRVGPRHQRGMEGRGNLRDHREAAQDREDEDGQCGEELGAHALASGGASSFFTASLRISPMWVIVTGPAISSAGSRFNTLSLSSCRKRAEMLRA